MMIKQNLHSSSSFVNFFGLLFIIFRCSQNGIYIKDVVSGQIFFGKFCFFSSKIINVFSELLSIFFSKTLLPGISSVVFWFTVAKSISTNNKICAILEKISEAIFC